MKILITGAAGYIGGMLTEQFKEGPDVQILSIDIRNQPKELEHPRITWFVADLAKADWYGILGGVKPDVVIHAAWARGKNDLLASNVFDYSIRNKIPKFILLSAIDVYGTQSESSYIENDPPRAAAGYGAEVALSELAVKKLYGGSGKHTCTFILRLPIVFGPRAWQKEHFFGTLGLFKRGGLPLVIDSSAEVAFQALHEDDLVDVVGLLAFNKLSDPYEVYNVTPEDAVPASGIATVFGKKTIVVSSAIKRILSFNHSPRLDRSIIADGRKFTKKFKYKFNYSSYEALTTEEGRYAQ